MPARYEIVNEYVTPNYHIFSRCVRRAFLCADKDGSRKKWLEDRLEFLSRWFSIRVLSYAFMDNHFHLVVHLDTPSSKNWANREVAYRWAQVFTPKGDDGKPIAPQHLDDWLNQKETDDDFIDRARKVLSNLGWFMKSLKEPMARLANRQDGQKGTFWDGRYKSVPILDETALLATSIYVDLNPFTILDNLQKPFSAKDLLYTSLHLRWCQVANCQQLDLLPIALSQPTPDPVQNQAANHARQVLRALEQELWVIPIHNGQAQDPTQRKGLSDRMDFPDYLQVVKAIAQQRQDIANLIPPEVLAKLKAHKVDFKQLRAMVERLKTVEEFNLWGRARGTEGTLNEAAQKRNRKRYITHHAKYAQFTPAKT